jgi:hypothetical protein
MAIICPRCKSQYDITLFQFGRTLKCDCGYSINPNRGVILNNAKRKNHKKTEKYIKVAKRKEANI